MKELTRNVWILAIAQSLAMSVGSVVVFVGGIVGAGLAPNEKMATLPVALMIVGTALSVVPVTQLMKKLGRKNSFTVLMSISILNALGAAFAISEQSFYMFCANSLFFGITNACIMQFRFAAMESVRLHLVPTAASTVLIGGIVAAFIGPEIAVAGRNIFKMEFMGSFIFLAGVFAIAMLVLRLYNNVAPPEEHLESKPRPLKEITGQRLFWVALSAAATGYLVMSFIMTATPVSMNLIDHHSLDSTKYVIQSHIVAMFAPSIFTGYLIRKFGISRMIILGLLAFILCVIIAYSGHAFQNYWVSLILLGIGWNFLFIGGTSMLPQSYEPSERFKVQALNDSIIFGSQAVASLTAGWLVFTIGWESMMLIVVPLIIIQGWIIMSWSRKSRFS